jgi:hypothetical protein
MSRWFRHYAGMCRDEKLVRVAVKAGQTVERVVWVYGAILESAAEINDGGKYELDEAEVAYFLRASVDDIRAIVDGLISHGRLCDGVVAKWGDRQCFSDSSADRQRRYRTRQKQDLDVTKDPLSVTRNVTTPSPDVTVTPPYTDTDTEKIEDASASSTRAPSEVSDLRKAIVDAFAAAGSINIPDTSRASIWLERGWKPPICVAVISEILSRKPSVSSLGYFEKAIADAHVAPQGQARPPTNNYGPKPIVVSMTPEDRAAALAKTGTRWVEYDTAEWSRVADLWKADKGKYPPHPQGGWYFPESYFAAEHAA